MKPYYEESGIVIYHGDCREILPQLSKVDLVLTDPPYGINWKPPVNHQDQPWVDDTQFDPSPFMAIGKHHLFFGANYFADKLQPTNSWLTWVKRPINMDFSLDKRSYATTELAWTDFGCGCRFICHVWDGGKRAGDAENRTFCHPAQKPIEVMSWCLLLAPDAPVTLDPYMGSGTTLVAAKRLGRKAIGIEIEECYCEIAADRLRRDERPLLALMEPEQASLDLDESTPHRSDDWLRALGAQDAIKEEVLSSLADLKPL